MSRCGRRLALLLAVLALAGAAPAAHAQSGRDDGVEQLWKQFPLEERGAGDAATPRPRPTGTATATAAARSGSGRADGGDPPWVIIGAGGLLVAAASLGAGTSRRRRRRRPAPGVASARQEALDAGSAWAEGALEEGGAFAGAVEYTGRNMLLVRDDDRGRIWVRRSEVARLVEGRASARGSRASHVRA